MNYIGRLLKWKRLISLPELLSVNASPESIRARLVMLEVVAMYSFDSGGKHENVAVSILFRKSEGSVPLLPTPACAFTLEINTVVKCPGTLL